MSRYNLQFAICILQFAILLAGHVANPSSLQAAEPSVLYSPVSPQESLKHLVVPKGLTVELVASEPNVIDPVAVRFDENGRMWVVEMRDYPTTEVTGSETHSWLKVLDDRDGDGYYESATVVADNLRHATGVQPWKGGAFVTMAGKVAYLKDTTGDDKADVFETWYTGFAEENTQLRANHPRLALDNHIYIANGLRGGEIVDARSPKAKPVSISGMDFRFDPLTRRFEAVSGVGQFGLTFDDYNNRFVCSNRNPAMHVVLEDRFLKQNPLVAVPAVTTDVAKAGADSRLFPIGRSWTTSHLHANQFTAACGLDIYRGDTLPDEFYGNIFVCEPTAHLVHREVMKPLGVTFTSSPVEEGIEFLASRDEWFSPVNLEIGPDGALYVVDMYRAVIEHPHWMPAELRNRPDLLDGIDRGRIYRIVPKDFRRPAPPRMSDMPSEKLVELLAHRNAWWRETAARLLLERQDKSVARQLQNVALRHDSPLARIHALWILQGLDSIDADLLAKLLDDDNPRIVEQAIIAAEQHVAKNGALKDRITQLTQNADARVRFHALVAATPLPSPPAYPADQWELDAILIAAGELGGTALAIMLKDPAALASNVSDPKGFVASLARLAGASPDKSQQIAALEALLSGNDFRVIGLTSLFTAALHRGESLDSLQSRLNDSQRRALDQTFDKARVDASDSAEPVANRCDAIALLALANDAEKTLTTLAVEGSSQTVRLAAIAALARRGEVEPWRQLLAEFSGETPAVQRAILDGLFASPKRLALLLDAVGAGDVKPIEIDANRSKQILNHADPAVTQRAEKLLADAVPADREQVLAEYQNVLDMESSPARGRAIFEKNCATCHRIDNVGVDVAPDISDSREKLPEQLLTDIIQPNRAIDSNYFSYTVTTTDGLTYTGILTAETSTSVTLKQTEGKAITLPRDQVEDLHSDGVSFMPDGMEKNIPPQDMADLIAFIKNWRYLTEAPELAR
ncbi:MAG: c-type cytochrome [Planctomycetes bacterium]|nr:c-type cytochrome [Planctomycetota bacterium]